MLKPNCKQLLEIKKKEEEEENQFKLIVKNYNSLATLETVLPRPREAMGIDLKAWGWG